MAKVLVCGSRGWTDKAAIQAAIIRSLATEIIHGGARGADSLAGDVAWELKIPARVYRAAWGLFGKRAGMKRNQEMLDRERPDLVLAFWDGTSSGTADMIKRSQEAGFPVEVFLCQKHSGS